MVDLIERLQRLREWLLSQDQHERAEVVREATNVVNADLQALDALIDAYKPLNITSIMSRLSREKTNAENHAAVTKAIAKFKAINEPGTPEL